jgi:hypothetical protein
VLADPLNDIHIVGVALKAIGFEALSPSQSARRVDMLIAIRAFAEKLRNAGPDAVGRQYCSGRGIASAGENYLIPVDALAAHRRSRLVSLQSFVDPTILR